VAELRSKGFFSQDAADAKAHEATAAQASSRAAQALLDAARRDQERAHTDLAALGRLRAQARLTSPADGVVTARLVEPGSTVVAGQAVLQLADPASVWVRARIDQGQAGGVRVGQPVRIVLRSDPARPLAGEVRRIDQVSDAVAEERIVNVAFTARPPALPLGELVEVTIDLARLPDALSVPTAALARLDRREGVWLVRDGRAQFRALSTGVASQDGRTQVLSGIASGDEVVVHSERVLRPGARVKVVDAIHRGEP
jgi:RND family efflux transporter MFP subunit